MLQPSSIPPSSATSTQPAFPSLLLSEMGIAVLLGVLCCVSAALVLAAYAWPIVTNHESLEAVW